VDHLKIPFREVIYLSIMDLLILIAPIKIIKKKLILYEKRKKKIGQNSIGIIKKILK